MSAGIAWGAAIYWCIGILWLSGGFLPKKFGGWIEFHPFKPPVLWCAVFVVGYGAVWPLVWGKIVYTTLWKGDRYTWL